MDRSHGVVGRNQFNPRVGDCRADWLLEGGVWLELECARLLETAQNAHLLRYWKPNEIEMGSRPQVRRLCLNRKQKKIRVDPCRSRARVAA